MKMMTNKMLKEKVESLEEEAKRLAATINSLGEDKELYRKQYEEDMQYQLDEIAQRDEEIMHFLQNTPKHVACGFQFSPGYRVYGTKDAISKLKEELKSPIQSGSIGDLFDGEE